MGEVPVHGLRRVADAFARYSCAALYGRGAMPGAHAVAGSPLPSMASIASLAGPLLASPPLSPAPREMAGSTGECAIVCARPFSLVCACPIPLRCCRYHQLAPVQLCTPICATAEPSAAPSRPPTAAPTMYVLLAPACAVAIVVPALLSTTVSHARTHARTGGRGMRSHWRVCTRSSKHALARSSLHTMTGRAPAHAAAHRRTHAHARTLAHARLAAAGTARSCRRRSHAVPTPRPRATRRAHPALAPLSI